MHWASERGFAQAGGVTDNPATSTHATLARTVTLRADIYDRGEP